MGLTRAINEVGYQAVRSVSKDRIILLMPNGMGSQGLIKYVYPNPSFLPSGGADPYLGVSVHSYDPWDFCGQDGRIDHFKSIAAMKAALDTIFGPLAEWYYEAQIPMHVGEYGLGRTDDHMTQRDTEMARAY